MFETYVNQLRSADPNQRREAIIALANSRELAALKPLAEVFQHDPDPALRELALKAGRYIRRYAVNADDESVQVSERDRALAQKLLDAATTYHLQGDKGRAVDSLGKALSLNPMLRKESFTANLIMSLTGMGVDEAMPLLTHPDRRRALIDRLGGKRRLQHQAYGAGAASATWDNVVVDLVLYALVVALSTAAIFIFALDTLRELIESAPGNTLSSTDLDALFNASMVGIMLLGGFYGIYSALTLVIQGGAIHVVATMLFGGDGPPVYLYRRLVPFMTYFMLALALIFIGLALTGSAVEFWLTIPLIMLGLSVFASYGIARLIGEVYHFGTGLGCVTLILGGILIAVLAGLGNAVLTKLLTSAFGG